MRVNVASTGDAAGCGGWGFARSRSARYSSTGSTTQPSGETGKGVVCAVARGTIHSAHTDIVTSRARVIASSFSHGAIARDARTHRWLRHQHQFHVPGSTFRVHIPGSAFETRTPNHADLATGNVEPRVLSIRRRGVA